MKDSIISLIYNFYPKNISYFDDAYYSTPEYFNLRNIIKKEDPRWPKLVTDLSSRFRSDYVRDRTDGEPGNRCIIYTFQQELLYEIVIHISKMVDYHSFYVKKIFVDKINIYSKELEKAINTGFPEIESELEFILNAIKLHYGFPLMPRDISEIPVPDISTLQKDLGKTTIFDAVFAGSEL